MHAVCLATLVTVPSAQLRHAEVPVAGWYEPAKQDVHAVTPVAFENDPAAHSRQSFASSLRYSPGWHCCMLMTMGGEGAALPD